MCGNSHSITLKKLDHPFYERYGFFIMSVVVDGIEQKRKLLFKHTNGRLTYIAEIGGKFWLLPNDLVKDIATEAVNSLGNRYELHRVVYFGHADQSMVMTFIDTTRELKLCGDNHMLGFTIVNSEDGSSSFKIGGYLVRRICSNGMVVHEKIVRNRLLHIRRKEWLEDSDALIGRVRSLIDDTVKDVQSVIAYLNYTTDIHLNEDIAKRILQIVPAKVFRGDMIDVIQKTVVVDTDKTVYDALCRVTEYATHTTKKEHQLYTMTRKMSKLVYDIVRDSGRLTE